MMSNDGGKKSNKWRSWRDGETYVRCESEPSVMALFGVKFPLGLFLIPESATNPQCRSLSYRAEARGVVVEGGGGFGGVLGLFQRLLMTKDSRRWPVEEWRMHDSGGLFWKSMGWVLSLMCGTLGGKEGFGYPDCDKLWTGSACMPPSLL